MPRKVSSVPEHASANHGELKKGEKIVDNTGGTWKLGKVIGIGGFGEIYDVVQCGATENSSGSQYVAKIEKHSSGPLFVEINCYLRLGTCSMIEQWKTDKNMDFLGLPHYVASGSHLSNGEKYRFLIMPKYEQDLEAIFREKRVFNLKTVLVIAMRMMDTLEYIHGHGYIHSDIKASNIMLGSSTNRKSTRRRCPVQRYAAPLKYKKHLRKPRRVSYLRPLTITKYIDDIPDIVGLVEALGANISSNDEKPEVSSKTQPFQGHQVYLLDYGLASKFRLSNGEHRELSPDQRRAHAGTILFCSRDAHKGIVSRRSDLESLAYNMIYWLTGSLPWIDDINEPEVVERKKNGCFADINSFLNICFQNTPNFLLKMLNRLSELQCTDTPNYNFFRLLFTKAIKQYGYTNDAKLDLTNTEGWGECKSKETKSCKKENNTEFKRPSFLRYNPLKPLSSNIIFKRPKLRKKIRDKLAKNSMMNWSKILIRDPELIMKQGTVRKTPEEERPFSIQDFDLERLNPTAAMRDVFNKAADKEERPLYGSRGDELSKVDPVDGYTSEMMKVHQRMIEQRCVQLEATAVQQKRSTRRSRGSKNCIIHRPSPKSKQSRTETRATLRRAKSTPLRRTCRLKG
ncbi:serine/threonine-protein kinase VRK1 [Dendroctonus ponderosae]|uniref:serine/threonine-protein kinase VRK1 n=1 Tax=Dendroctonus ponderosae TaxID=77166 RepID=UPI00203625BA|nr:serine/threonine-protein kinase VRK1 [Dendroctonus ponderosae]KAH1010036.1 hypothetical protein HUJ05_004397 [Dendroctonus ponderosae]